jgi:hypothetical protein
MPANARSVSLRLIGVLRSSIPLRSTISLRPISSVTAIVSVHSILALLFFVCSSLFATPAVSAGHPDQPANPDHPKNGLKATSEVRKFHFPDKSIGALLVVEERREDDCWYTYRQGVQVGSAQGSVSVTVPPNNILLMDANRRVFENPILLKEVSPGLDALKLSFMSMEDREDHMLERAMGYVENLKTIRAIIFDRSEVTDVEVSKLKNLPHLCYLNFFLTQIDGSCFKNLSAFPELYQLDVPTCHLDQRTIADLAQIRKLRYLDLGRTGMSIVGARSLSKLTTLVRLNLSQNYQFDDACIKNLQPLTKLSWLDVRQTKVTFEGIKYLRGLKFRELMVPACCRKNMREVKAMFPSAEITLEMAPGTPTKEDKLIYGPLH